MTAVVPAGVAPGTRESVERFVAYLETGAAEGLFTPDVFCDLTLPHWRIQVRGAEQLVATKARLHPPGGRTRMEKLLAGPGGYAIKVEERWEDGGQQWYCREAFLCDLDEQGRVSELSVYCTGDWDEARVATHADAVTLLRP